MIPSLDPKKFIRALKKAGFCEIKKKGTNYTILHKEGCPLLRVPTYRQRDVPKGTLHAILTAAGLTDEEFLKLL